MANNVVLDKETILERKDFHRLPRNTQRELMEYWRENYPTGTIRERMGLSGTAFYNLLKRLKLPTNVQRVRVDDVYLQEELPVIQEENIDTDDTDTTDNNIVVSVSLVGEINIHDLPELVLKAHEGGFELEIKEIVEEITES